MESSNPSEHRQSLLWSMNLSFVIGLLMLGLKVGAYWLTGSAAILSDAAESVVHVAAVAFASFSLRLSFRPPDKNHPYGHSKIGFFSAGFEGGLIALAACFILFEAVRDWISGHALHRLGVGGLLTLAATLINGALGAYLVAVGRRRNSLILVANGKHVFTDCWTSLGVLLGVGLTLLTGWRALDPLVGIAMALHILWSGYGLLRQSVSGLLDEADPEATAKIEAILTEETRRRGISFHELRHRHSGDGHLIDVHLLFAADQSLAEAHRLATEIEEALASQIEPFAEVHTHLEPLEEHDAAHARVGGHRLTPPM
jgi:cation diffusion facilitator family transporter